MYLRRWKMCAVSTPVNHSHHLGAPASGAQSVPCARSVIQQGRQATDPDSAVKFIQTDTIPYRTSLNFIIGLILNTEGLIGALPDFCVLVFVQENVTVQKNFQTRYPKHDRRERKHNLAFEDMKGHRRRTRLGN